MKDSTKGIRYSSECKHIFSISDCLALTRFLILKGIKIPCFSLSLLVIGSAIFLIASFDDDRTLLSIAFECFSNARGSWPEKKYNIIVLTTLKITRETKMLGTKKNVTNVKGGVASSKTILHKDEIMVLYGPNKDLKELLKDQEKY